jgi:hypothetical protein
MAKILLPALALLLFLPNLLDLETYSLPAYDQKEQFNPQLAYINSIDMLEAHTDSLAVQQNICINSYEYAELLEAVLKDRFYHGFSKFSLKENWIAALSGKWLEEGLACKVQPNDIMQDNNAACSQQSIVMMAVLRRKNIPYRKVGFPHHYAMEVSIGNNWYFMDADMEPVIKKTERMERSWNHQNDLLKKYYSVNRFNDLDYKFGSGLTATNGPVAEVPASNARIFHSVTFVLSKLLWCFPLLLLLFNPAISFAPSHSLITKRRNPQPISLAV